MRFNSGEEGGSTAEFLPAEVASLSSVDPSRHGVAVCEDNAGDLIDGDLIDGVALVGEQKRVGAVAFVRLQFLLPA